MFSNIIISKKHKNTTRATWNYEKDFLFFYFGKRRKQRREMKKNYYRVPPPNFAAFLFVITKQKTNSFLLYIEIFYCENYININFLSSFFLPLKCNTLHIWDCNKYWKVFISIFFDIKNFRFFYNEKSRIKMKSRLNLDLCGLFMYFANI